MKAIPVKEFGGTEVLKLGTLPEPPPGWKQVAVRLEAIGNGVIGRKFSILDVFKNPAKS